MPVWRRARRLHDLRPGGRDGVERERVLRPAVLLGDREQQERELLDELGVDRAVGTLLRAREERAGNRQAVALQDRDEVVQHLPRADAVVREDVVALRHLCWRQQRDLAGGAREDAVADQRLDRRVAGAREVVGDPELARRVAVLAVPGDREARRGVEVALLLVEHLVEDLVDPRERRAHGHRRAVVLDDLRVAREHRHPGADRGLRQIDRRDRALLELAQRVRQLVVQRGDQTTAISRRRVVGTRSQREDDR